MKFILSIIFLGIFAICSAQTNSSHTRVSGYLRKDGTYVQGHYRTSPNATINDNFSTYGNINPYTGKHGWITRESASNPLATFESLMTKKQPVDTIITGGSITYRSDHDNYGVIRFKRKPKTFLEDSDLFYNSLDSEHNFIIEKGNVYNYLVDGSMEFYEDGVLVLKATYDNGLAIGEQMHWRTDGSLETIVKYDDKGEYLSIKYFESNYIVSYASDGSETYYTPNDIKSHKITPLENGDTTWVKYYDNGIPEVEAVRASNLQFKTDRPYNGTLRGFFSNGQLRTIQNYKQGFPSGEFTYYDSSGTVIGSITAKMPSKVDTIILERYKVEGFNLIDYRPIENNSDVEDIDDRHVRLPVVSVGSVFYNQSSGRFMKFGNWYWVIISNYTNKYIILKEDFFW